MRSLSSVIVHNTQGLDRRARVWDGLLGRLTASKANQSGTTLGRPTVIVSRKEVITLDTIC